MPIKRWWWPRGFRDTSAKSQDEADQGDRDAGPLELNVPSDWPDGSEVVIEPTTAPLEKIGIDESQWRNDPESLADWEAWLRTFEPFELTPDEARRNADFAEPMRLYNIEAVRR